MWMDQTTPARAQGMVLHRAGETYAVRTIALDIPVYSTGLLAADRLPDDVVAAVRDAIAAAHELQRDDPEPGLAAFARFFPTVAEERTKVNWALYEPYAFDGPTPGSMNLERWRETISFVSRTHDLPAVHEEQLVRT